MWILTKVQTGFKPSEKYACQIGSSPQVGANIKKHIWNYHQAKYCWFSLASHAWNFRRMLFSKQSWPHGNSLGIQSYSQLMIGESNHLLSMAFRFHSFWPSYSNEHSWPLWRLFSLTSIGDRSLVIDMLACPVGLANNYIGHWKIRDGYSTQNTYVVEIRWI